MTQPLADDRKRVLRDTAKRRRADLAPRAAALKERMCRAFRDAADFDVPPAVAGYWPTAEEADIRPLLSQLHGRGHRCALPVVTGNDQPLGFRHWTPESRLIPGRFGISVPEADADAVVPDLLFVPLLAFDRHGARLGYGGGFYDRTLAALRRERPVRAIGVAFSAQEMDAIPCEPHDEPLDGVLTEHRLLLFRQHQSDTGPGTNQPG